MTLASLFSPRFHFTFADHYRPLSLPQKEMKVFSQYIYIFIKRDKSKRDQLFTSFGPYVLKKIANLIVLYFCQASSSYLRNSREIGSSGRSFFMTKISILLVLLMEMIGALFSFSLHFLLLLFLQTILSTSPGVVRK